MARAEQDPPEEMGSSPLTNLPCIACGRHTGNVVDAPGNNPKDQTVLFAVGNYGSGLFDPPENEMFSQGVVENPRFTLEVNLCDGCMQVAIARKRVILNDYVAGTTGYYSPFGPVSA